MHTLQVPGGPEVLVIGLIVLVFFVLVGLAVYLFYRLLISPPEAGAADGSGGLSPSVRQTVDVIVAIALVLVGFAGAVLGGFLITLADRDVIRDLVEDETIESDVLGTEDLVDVVHSLLVWGGGGTLVAGGVVLLSGVGLALYRRRLDRRMETEPESAPSMAANALVGAVASVAVSFIPFSAAIGGGLAGYLQGEDGGSGLRAGILTGLFIGVPSTIIAGAVAIGLFLTELPAIGLVVLVALAFTVLFTVVLTAIGGYVGGYLVERGRRETPAKRPRRPPEHRRDRPPRERHE